jgi:hypothetical protein
MHVCWGKGGPKNYNIDYFEYVVNLEFKFKLNFGEEGVSKIEKKIQKKFLLKKGFKKLF